MTFDLDRDTRVGALWALVGLWLTMPMFAATPTGEGQAVDSGCILRSIEFEDQDQETVLRLGTVGDPRSIGARVEPDEGVVLDLAGCIPAADLTHSEPADGLVSAVRVDSGSVAENDQMAVRVQVRGGFEYSVSSQPGLVLVSLRAEASPAGDSRITVLEPLPPAEAATTRSVLAPLPSGSPLEAPSLLEDPPPVSPPRARDPTQEIARAVSEWAQAWSDQRVEAYLYAYSSDFQPPPGLSRPVWEMQRRQRLDGPQWIEVVIEGLEVRLIEPGWARADFVQSYTSNTYSDQVAKTLTLKMEDGSWRIQREESDDGVDAASEPQASSGFPFGPESTSETSSETSSGTSTGGEIPASAPETAESEIQPETSAVVEGARISIQRAPAYDASYQFISYPGGDPGWEIGSGSDVVIRAYRHVGVDLQERVHEDILADASPYGIQEPDPRIDHRRIRNLLVFLRRHGSQLGLGRTADWQPGDIVFWSVDGKPRANHLGIVSDRQGPSGQWMVIHHDENGPPREEDVLFTWDLRGHFRWLPAE